MMMLLTRRTLGPSGPVKVAKKEADAKPAAKPAAKTAAKPAAKVSDACVLYKHPGRLPC